jgi:hypothetical protein
MEEKDFLITYKYKFHSFQEIRVINIKRVLTAQTLKVSLKKHTVLEERREQKVRTLN